MTLHLALLIICVPFKANRDAAHSKLRFFYRIFFSAWEEKYCFSGSELCTSLFFHAEILLGLLLLCS